MNQTRINEVKRKVRQRIRDGVPRSLWSDQEVMVEAYEMNGNVLGSGADLPGTARPIIKEANNG